MFKILVLVFLIWIFIKALGQILRTVTGGSSQNRSTQYDQRRSQQRGSVHVDYDPKDKNKKGFDGGEYVDYEEVD